MHGHKYVKLISSIPFQGKWKYSLRNSSNIQNNPLALLQKARCRKSFWRRVRFSNSSFYSAFQEPHFPDTEPLIVYVCVNIMPFHFKHILKCLNSQIIQHVTVSTAQKKSFISVRLPSVTHVELMWFICYDLKGSVLLAILLVHLTRKDTKFKHRNRIPGYL